MHSEAAANRVMKSVVNWLEKHLKVQVNATKTKVCRPNEMKYLGYSFYNKNGWKPKPHLKSIEKLKQKLKEVTSRNKPMSMEERIQKLNPIIRGWVNYFRIADMKSWMENIDGWLRTRIRICIWKQWKTPQRRRWGLRKLGVPEERAYMWSNSRKGYARVASSPIMAHTVTKSILSKKGLLSLADQYASVHITCC